MHLMSPSLIDGHCSLLAPLPFTKLHSDRRAEGLLDPTPAAYPMLQVKPLSVNEVGGEFVLFQVAWNPGSTANDSPAGIVLFTDWFVTVTTLPVCEKLPFHPRVIVCPLVKANCRVQPFIASVPVLVIVRPAWKPPGQVLTTLYCTCQLIAGGVAVGVIVGVGVAVGVVPGVGVGVAEPGCIG